MQRLFTMFPTGMAGSALFVLRVLAAATFVVDGTAHWALVTTFWIFAAVAIPAFLLCVGLLTPYSSAMAILLQLGVLVMNGGSRDGLHLASSVVICGVVAVLGPGAYSMDAHLFGRRLLTLPSPPR